MIGTSSKPYWPWNRHTDARPAARQISPTPTFWMNASRAFSPLTSGCSRSGSRKRCSSNGTDSGRLSGMNKRIKPRFKPCDIALTQRAISFFLPLDTPLISGFRLSLRGVPCFRIESTTNGKLWSVDIYSRRYFLVSVGSRMPKVCRNLKVVLGYLSHVLEE